MVALGFRAAGQGHLQSDISFCGCNGKCFKATETGGCGGQDFVFVIMCDTVLPAALSKQTPIIRKLQHELYELCCFTHQLILMLVIVFFFPPGVKTLINFHVHTQLCSLIFTDTKCTHTLDLKYIKPAHISR